MTIAKNETVKKNTTKTNSKKAPPAPRQQFKLARDYGALLIQCLTKEDVEQLIVRVQGEDSNIMSRARMYVLDIHPEIFGIPTYVAECKATLSDIPKTDQEKAQLEAYYQMDLLGQYLDYNKVARTANKRMFKDNPDLSTAFKTIKPCNDLFFHWEKPSSEASTPVKLPPIEIERSHAKVMIETAVKALHKVPVHMKMIKQVGCNLRLEHYKAMLYETVSAVRLTTGRRLKDIYETSDMETVEGEEMQLDLTVSKQTPLPGEDRTLYTIPVLCDATLLIEAVDFCRMAPPNGCGFKQIDQDSSSVERNEFARNMFKMEHPCGGKYDVIRGLYAELAYELQDRHHWGTEWAHGDFLSYVLCHGDNYVNLIKLVPVVPVVAN